jgi:DNA-binding transcriptional MerR regulator
MTDMPDQDQLLTAAECAHRLGLTPRALRLYEARGLIEPRRTEKNWRLYGGREIARLGEVLVLRKMGLTLSAIAQLLAGRETDLAGLLMLQEEALREQQIRIEQSLSIVRSLKAKQASGEVLSADDMIKLAKETMMTETQEDSVAWKRYEQNRPRTAIKIAGEKLADYIGCFQMDDGSLMSVTVEGEQLLLQLVGQPPADLEAEAEDAFFNAAVQAQVTFQRDEAGKVTSLVLHQHGAELPALRVDDSAFAEAEAQIKARMAEKTPAPGSEAMLQTLLEQQCRGEVDYSLMNEPLAELARAQAHLVKSELDRLGALGTVQFKGVDPTGFDVYDVEFAKGRQEWSISMAADGKVNGLAMRNTL